MSEIIVSAHQPNFLPYLGFYDKMAKSDIFVIRDEVLFVKKDYHQRNKIRINGNDNLNNPQFKWLKIPVDDIFDHLQHVKIDNTKKEKVEWNTKMLQEIKAAYGKAPFFNQFFPEFSTIINTKEESLVALNMKIINFIKNAFGLKTKIIMASELGLKPMHYEKTDASIDLANICHKLGATIYLSGAGGKGYLNLEPFDKFGIKVEYQEYHHPAYKQNFPGFAPYMGAIDALFCVGKLPECEETQNQEQLQTAEVSQATETN